MNIHKNARTTPYSRLLMARRVGAGENVARVAADFCVSGQTVRKWARRWQMGGTSALQDRSSRPRRLRSTAAERVATIERLRRQRTSSPAIARQLGLPISTVAKILCRLGLNRLKALDPPVPVVRYQRARPGELVHMDTKKLGRIEGIGHRITGRRPGAVNRHHGIGWEFLHVCVDDACRLAYCEILPDERKESATAFLERALAWLARHGVAVERIMTDNGSCYLSQSFRKACVKHGVRHLRTRPYRPRTTDVIDKDLFEGFWGFWSPCSSLFGRGEPFLRPGLPILVRRAQGWSRLTEGHRRRRLGLDHHEHGATLGYRRASLLANLLSRTDDLVAKSRV